MGILTKEALLGASDVQEKEVELPSIGGSVRVRTLPARYSSQCQAEALEMKGDGREQVATYNVVKIEELQLLHGLIEPKLSSLTEVRVFTERCGPAVKAVTDAIEELSGIDKAALESAEARFPAQSAGASAEGEADSPAGDS